MNEPCELPVTYKGEDVMFPAELRQLGYTQRIVVDIYGTKVYFEPDEGRAYRTIGEEGTLKGQVTVDLLRAIAESIKEIVK